MRINMLHVLALAIIGIIAGALVLDAKSCSSKWGSSRMRTQWGPLSGCLVETQPGKWIPTDQYREVP